MNLGIGERTLHTTHKTDGTDRITTKLEERFGRGDGIEVEHFLPYCFEQLE
jgi:hypothetical protein